MYSAFLKKPFQRNVLEGAVWQRSPYSHRQNSSTKLFQCDVYRTRKAFGYLDKNRSAHGYLKSPSPHYPCLLETSKLGRSYLYSLLFLRRVLILPHAWVSGASRGASRRCWRGSHFSGSNDIVDFQYH